MNAEVFEFILNKVAPLITRHDTKWRLAISAKERLAVTLRFLATGESFASLSYQFRVGESTISKTVSETCEALHHALANEYLKTPSTEEEWLEIAEDFHIKCGTLVDTEDADHRLVEGTWRKDGPGRPGNSSMAAKQIRDKLKSYFVTPAGQVPWQENYI
ncbi:unnamed protein product [Leuciscus chuanchicus]